VTNLPGDEAELLRQYVSTRSQDAFRRLVDRYVNVVYAAARRQVADGDLARDVTQAVFLILAEKAGELDPQRPISGWLLQVTRYASANAVRARARRARHEQRAAEMATTTTDHESDAEWRELSPLLDEGISRLRAKDRDVLLLRFFEHKTARQVAEAMGISEDAAEKRIARAVAKLRDFFQRRGVTVSLVALATTLAANCAEAAPVGLTASIAASAASAATSSAATLTSTSIAKGTVLAMASAKTKTILVAACALLLVGGGAVGVTKLVNSSKPRRVVLNPPATTLPAGTAAVPTPQSLTFAQGTTIDLLYVSDDPANASRWWSADGTPVAPPSPPPDLNRISLGGDGPNHLLVLRQTDPGGLNPSMTVSVVRANVAGAASTADQSGAGVRMHSYLFNTRGPAPAVVDVRVGLASGPWSEVQRYPLSTAASRPAPAAEVTKTAPSTSPALPSEADVPALMIVNVREGKNGMTEVEFRFAQNGQRFRTPLDEKIVLVNAEGREFYAQSWTGRSGGSNVLGFSVPRGQAAALTYQSRPYEMREIRNVSLQPGQKTAVAIGAAPRRGGVAAPAPRR
jgi:RNA polymerase sigma factor (sigma-70 family)